MIINNLFGNYETVDFAKRASCGSDEFLNDKKIYYLQKEMICNKLFNDQLQQSPKVTG